MSVPVLGFDDGTSTESIRFSAARQARLQYAAMQNCDHDVTEDELCAVCLGSFASIHAQHTFLEATQLAGESVHGH